MILDPDILELIGYPRRTAQDAADELLDAMQPPSSWVQQFTDEHDAMRALIIAISKQLIEERAAKPIRFADLTTY